MPNLRSRQIPSPTKTRSTPTSPTEPVSSPNPVRRSSRRLSSSNFTPSPKRTRTDPDFTPSPKRNRNDVVSSGKNPNFDRVNCNANDGSVSVSGGELGQIDVINQRIGGDEVLSLRSGTRVVKRLSIGGDNDEVCDDSVELDGLIGSVIDDVDRNNDSARVRVRVRVRVSDVELEGVIKKRVSIGGADDGKLDGVSSSVVDVDKELGQNEVFNRENDGVGLVGQYGTNGFLFNDVELDGVIGSVIDDIRELGQKDGFKESKENESLSLRSGTRVLKRLSIGGVGKDVRNLGKNDNDGVRVSDVVQELSQNDGGKDANRENEFLSVQSGNKVEKRVSIGGDNEDVGNVVKNDSGFNDGSKVEKRVSSGDGDDVLGNVVTDNIEVVLKVKEEEGGGIDGDSNVRSRRKYSSAEKGKRRLIVDGQDGVVKMKEDDSLSSFVVEEGLVSPKRYTREEKGKGVASSDDVVIGENDDEGLVTLDFEPEEDFSVGGLNSDVEADHGFNFGDDVNEGNNNVLEDPLYGKPKSMREIHKDIARRNASKYAHFSIDDDETKNEETGLKQEDGNDTESEAEVPQEDIGLNVEEWPGPFSTAMKIIRDREKKMGVQAKKDGVSIGDMPLISWTPSNKIGTVGAKKSAPSLQNMCLKILAENVDAIHSLNYVPEVLRHKLCQMLCNSRRMNAHFFSLLLQGSPVEIRVADCSWLEEEEFESSIKACDTSKLTVLQLDLCGHCVSDSSLIKAVAPKGLPVLTTISLKGACRISDAGLAALVSAAPVLRSMNLSQCSLLTVVGIKTIADSLGSIVHELYLDDCDTLDAMSILPSLKRLVHLEVLSLRGIGGVSDKFIKKLIRSNGHNMKELVLANCVNLTDSSLKVITEKCSQLCVLDLSYLRKLTDVGMAYLANGCRGIQDLRLCRNAFSDCAIAAFLEASGESLKELSLNNLTKVGLNTTLSLARRCKNLERLDLSWCRSLTDEALGLIADSCMSLRLLKIFGCTQISKIFLDGHSNANLHVVGMKLTPILEHIKRPDFQHGPLYYSAVPSS